MQVTIKEVEKIAALSRLSFSEDKKEELKTHLDAILQTAKRLDELDTENVEPTAHIQGVSNVLREDIIRESMENELLTANAPERENGCFIVPKIVE